MAQISFSLKGVFCPTILPLFQGGRPSPARAGCAPADYEYFDPNA